LTRAALGAGRIDAASFTVIRLVTGAATLLLLSRIRTRRSHDRGSWRSAVFLGGYAVAFTLAYLRIGASAGALILFGTVQVTMVGVGLARGERPARIDWAGFALACAGLLVLTLPGVTAPDPLGLVLMFLAGIGWGLYSLAGRGSRDPLGATTGNFVRASAFGVLFVLLASRSLHFTSAGVWLAVASGSLASGVGYTLWYAALPSLAAWRAAILQLLVPVLTALVAAGMLNEPVTARLAAAAGLIAAGVWLTVWPSWHQH
jgi:drug/metabolite transporter (DMT)-like permease